MHSPFCLEQISVELYVCLSSLRILCEDARIFRFFDLYYFSVGEETVPMQKQS